MTKPDFVSLEALRGRGPSSPDTIIAEIRRIYFKTAKKTIQHDLAHAIELLKQLPDEDTRDRAAVYMDGLSQMRSEWGASATGKSQKARGKRSEP